MLLRHMKNLNFIFFSLSFFSRINGKNNSKKLAKGETWAVEKIRIDGMDLTTSPYTWFVEGEDFDKHSPLIRWFAKKGPKTYIGGQFEEKGKYLVLDYFSDAMKYKGCSINGIDNLAQAISGKYQVTTNKDKLMVFKSSETRNYAGQEVEIKILKK